jgi:uncharacterized membrane protein
MVEAAFVVLVFAFPLLVGAMRGWPALLLPVIGWPLFYVGLDRGWWGRGTGDGWQYLAVLMTTIGVVTTALAVALSHAVGRRPRPHE